MRAAPFDVDGAPALVARRRGLHPSLRNVPRIVAATDLVLIFLASVVAETIYVSTFASSGFDFGRSLGVAAASGVLLVLGMHTAGMYTPEALTSSRRQIGRILLYWTGTLVFLSALVFVLKISPMFSRVTVGTFFVLGGIALVAERGWLASYLKQAFAAGTVSGPSIALIDCCEAGFGKTLQELDRYGFNIVRRLGVPRDATPEQLAQVADQALASIRGSTIEEVFITADCQSLRFARPMLARLSAAPLPVRLVLNERTTELFAFNPQRIGKLSTFEIQRAPLGIVERAIKRIMDVGIAGSALVVLAPLLIVIALAVRLDSQGPVFFRQRRNGFNGRSFRIYKFRSMTVLEDGAQVVQAQKNDNRVTRAGRWLRKTSLDELPQLINVLAGDMSVIGPRPHALSHDDYYSSALADYAFRQHVKPGITGWAQSNGYRGETATVELMQQRVEHDIWYINHWSLWLDVQILFRTVLEVVRTRNAY